MEINTEEKGLKDVKKDTFFYKIKEFFRNLFKKDKNEIWAEENIKETNIKQSAFLEDIKRIEDEETKVRKLQQDYEKGIVDVNKLSEEEFNQLVELYDTQIYALKKQIQNCREYKISMATS